MKAERLYGDRQFAEFYDANGLYRARQDTAFFVEEALASGGETLEVGCGTGRVLIPTARAGVRVTGLDASTGMLDVCRENLALETADVRDRVTLVEGDMRGFDLGRQFALATFPFRPFQHLMTVEDQLKCLACVRRHLVPGGRVILDLFNPSMKGMAEEGVKETVEPEFALPDGRRVVRTARVLSRDRFAQVLHLEFVHEVTHVDGRRDAFLNRFEMRYLFRFEAEHLLHRAGFMLEQVYAGYDRSPFGSKDPGELILMARKEG